MAMPFHSVETEEEADELVTLYCRQSYAGESVVTADWSSGDILAAMKSATSQFGLTQT